jgi:hypothetical protein
MEEGEVFNLKLLILSDCDRAKWSIMYRFLGHEPFITELLWPCEHDPPGFKSRRLYIDCQPVHVKVRSMSDFEFYMKHDHRFYRNCDGCLIVYSSD